MTDVYDGHRSIAHLGHPPPITDMPDSTKRRRRSPSSAWDVTAGEVNFSSDADVIIIYRPSDNADDDLPTFRAQVQEDLRAILQGPTTLEPKIELDMDLRLKAKTDPRALLRILRGILSFLGEHMGTRRCCVRVTHDMRPAAPAEDFLMNVADPLRYPENRFDGGAGRRNPQPKARMEAERLPRGVRRGPSSEARQRASVRRGMDDPVAAVAACRRQCRTCESTARCRHWTS